MPSEVLNCLKSKFFLICLGCALCIWIIGPLINAVLLHQGTIFQQLVHPEPLDIFMRSIFSVLIIIIGFMGSVLLHRVKQADERRNYEISDFLDNAHISLHWVGSDGTIIWANQYEMDNLGYTRDEYIGHHINEFHRDNTAIEDILNRLAKNETLINYEAVLKHKNGSFRNVLINSSALFRNDDFIYTRCITTDITERRKVDDARRESDLRYQQIVENATDIIYRTDIEGNISYLNHVALRISGYTHEEALGKHFTEGVVPAYRKEIMYFYKRQIRKQIQESYYEFPLLTKGGTEIWLGQNVQLIWKGK